MTRQAEFMPRVEEFETMIPVSESKLEPKTQYDEKIDELIDSFASTPNAQVSIYRQKGMNVNDGLTFLDSFPPDKYTREQIMKLLRDEYGTGDYRVQVRVKGKLRANELICIEAPKKPIEGHTSETAQIMDAVLTRLDRMQQQLFQPQKSAEQIEHDFLQKMLIMKQLFGQPQQSNNGLQEMLTLITGLKSAGLIQTPGDQEKESDGFMGFLSSMAPTLETIAKGAIQPRAMPAPQPYQQNPIQQPPVQPAQNPEVNTLISMGVITLCNAAEKQGDPAIYATWVLDQLPDEHLNEFAELLESDNWLDTLDAMSYNRAKPNAQWFGQVRELILAELTDDDGQIADDPERD